MLPLPFKLLYDPEIRRHLAAIERRYHSLIRLAIEEQLRYEPNIETRNRKPLLRATQLDAEWEIRFGPENRFRVYYRTDPAVHAVHILAIGAKVGNRLLIGGEEFML